MIEKKRTDVLSTLNRHLHKNFDHAQMMDERMVSHSFKWGKKKKTEKSIGNH